ncbi:cytochrome bc complex cytochrome b subunit [Agrococcus sp. 1P02AA]|uniref:cytochrome bc1 complex cytochrome b subunit n=1 Tax=Agrococcus sp. 1P02AA TaxID=3132259 RepID=UPI0039A60387
MTATATRPSLTAKASNYLDERTSISSMVAALGRKVFPDHWSFMLGEIILYSFVAILLSGTFLTFFFEPSMTAVHYEGSYVPLKGVEMSAAYASTLNLSFDVRGGLLMRQVHHWSALLFVAAIGLHMLRVFFTGAFRKPREINWVVGFILFILALAEGFTGYSLPDDLLSGNGLAIINGMVKGIPVVGTWISYLLFGGIFPGHEIVPRLFVLHIMLLPALVIAFIGIHMVLLIVNKHTDFAGPGKTNDVVVGAPIMPLFAAKAGAFFFIVFGVLVAIGSTFTILPVWDFGPYDPSPVSAGTQPDWYIGFADGALRLAPGWESEIFGLTLSWNILLPIAVLGLFIVLVMFYPFIEAWITGDKREHHIAERPRNNPTRTAIGAAGVWFYAILWAAASSDLIATHFSLNVFQVTWALQAALIVGTVIVYWLTKRIAIGLQKKDREILLHGYESGNIRRLPGGAYIEVHEQLDEYQSWKLKAYESYEPVMVRPNAKGKITAGTHLRSAFSRWFFEDRIAPITRTEIEAAKHDHH